MAALLRISILLVLLLVWGLAWLAGLVATVATFVMLYHQFRGDTPAGWVGHLLALSIAVWWFLSGRSSGHSEDKRPASPAARRLGRWLEVVAWSGVGALLAVAVASTAGHIRGNHALTRDSRSSGRPRLASPSCVAGVAGWRAAPPTGCFRRVGTPG